MGGSPKSQGGAGVPLDSRALGAADAAKNEFVSRVSHELRTPLNTILGFGELLALGELTGEQRDWVSMMVTAAHHLASVMDDIADISRMEARKLSLSVEPVPAQRLVADALELVRPLAAAHGVQLDPPPESGLFVRADQQRLRQVLLNLLSNAIKYNHPAGKVTIAVAGLPGGKVRISVADTGRGIAAPDLDRLFTPFQRLDAAAAGIEGTGLGLALCRQLVEAMAGTVGVTSTLGEGSTFWAELPATQPAQVSPAAGGEGSPAGARAYTSPKTILYVEDMVENLRLVEQVIKRRPSARLVPAMLGGVALDLAAEYHPDVILLDLHLPDMPGEELLHRFRADPVTSSTPVVILSADATRAQVRRLLAAGAAAYLTKPIGVRPLLETLDRLLGQPRPPASAPVPAGDQAAERIARAAAIEDGGDSGQ